TQSPVGATRKRTLAGIEQHPLLYRPYGALCLGGYNPQGLRPGLLHVAPTGLAYRPHSTLNQNSTIHRNDRAKLTSNTHHPSPTSIASKLAYIPTCKVIAAHL